MKSVRSIIFCLALVAAAPVALIPLEPAVAADVADTSPGLVGIVPIPWAVADGKSKVKVQVLALTKDGTPISGLALKPSASEGSATGWSEVGPGLYRFDFTPPKSDKAVEVTLTVSGKAGKSSVSATTKVKLARQPSSRLAGTTTPQEIVLGQNREATVSITGGPPKGELLVRNTTGGSIEDLTNMGGGKFTGRFQLPAEKYPQLGIVTVANAANPVEEYGYVAIPLSGAVAYPVKAPAGAKVLLQIGSKEFGPVEADAEGNAAVPIIVPPGTMKATQVTVVDGEPKEGAIDLLVPETQRVKAVPVARSIPADSDVEVPIRFVVLEKDGSPASSAKVVGSADKGQLDKFEHIGNGVYEATYTPEDADAAGTATIKIGLEGSDKQTDELTLDLIPRRATELLVTTDPKEVGADTTEVRLMMVANGSNGRPVSGQGFAIDVTGGERAGDVADEGEGRYSATVKRDAEVTKVGMVVAGSTSSNPAAHVLVLPARTRVNADGAAAMDVVIVTTDVFGYPVSGVEVELSADGGASIPSTTTTGRRGFSRVELTSGQEEALVSLTAKAGPARGAAAVLQGGKRKATKDIPISVSAAKARRMLQKSWEGAVANVRFAVDPDAPPPVPTLTLADPDATTAVLDVTFFPAEVAPGGTVTVRSIPFDDSGQAIPGKVLDVLTSAGKLGDTVETDGMYETSLTIDADAEGEAKVSVVSPSGVMKLVRVPINPDAVAPEGEAEEEAAEEVVSVADEEPKEEPEEEAVAEAPPKEPRTPPAAAGDHPWLRARVSGVASVYNYAQTPTNDPGPLIPAPLTVGGGDSAPATPVGFEFAGRAWYPDIPYVGVTANLRSAFYAISSSRFVDNAPDWIYDASLMAAGRYPFDVGADQYWVGGKAGFHYSDFMLFTGCLQADCEVNFDPLGMPGLGLGAEVGAEFDAPNMYFVGGYTHALANFSVPYMNSVDANVGMMVADPIDVDVGFSWISRKIALEGTDSGNQRGELSDSQLVFKLGVGFEI